MRARFTPNRGLQFSVGNGGLHIFVGHVHNEGFWILLFALRRCDVKTMHIYWFPLFVQKPYSYQFIYFMKPGVVTYFVLQRGENIYNKRPRENRKRVMITGRMNAYGGEGSCTSNADLPNKPEEFNKTFENAFLELKTIHESPEA